MEGSQVMRILQNQSVKTAGKSKKAGGSKQAGGVFSLEEGEKPALTQESGQVAGAAAIVGISSLLAIQEADPDQHRSKAILHGHDTLDALDSLKIDVLSGRVSRQKLHVLASLAEKERSGLADHTLMNILDHIELRAKVELAKLQQASK